MTTTHTTTVPRAQDTALASLVRAARAAISKCEQDCSDYGLADFNEQLAARETHSAKLNLCKWWIRFCGEHSDD